MKESPWKKFSSLQAYENKWFAVREDRVIGPDGEPGTYHVVSAGRLAVGVLPLWKDGSLTLVGQYRYPIKEYTWEVPEGGGEFDVDPLETARRELREETGIRAETWEYLGRTHTSNCFLDEVCHLFLATGLTQGVAEPGPEEILQVKRVPFTEAIAMVKDGRITDAISIAGIFHLLAHQQCGSRTVAR